MRHAVVRPIWHREPDERLAADRASIVGYRAESVDGYRGPRRATYQAAAADARAHNRPPARR